MISSCAFSQELKPIVLEVNHDTVFCFTINQSKMLAKRIELGRYCDSLTVKQQKLVKLLESISQTKDSINTGLERKVILLEQIKQNQGENIQLLKATIKKKDKKLKKSKVQKILLVVGLGLMAVLAIV